MGPLILAVLYFDNHTGKPDYDPLKKGLADMMVTDLADTPGVTVVERARIESLIAELQLETSDFFAESTAQKLGRGLGATHALTGALTAVAPQIRIDVRLIEMASGRVMMAKKIVGDPKRFFELESRLVQELLGALGKHAARLASGPRDLESALVYAQAIDRADRGDYAAAAQKMGEILQLDPEFQLAKERYGELGRRLREAGTQRTKALEQVRADLLKRIDPKSVCGAALSGNLVLLEMEQLIRKMTVEPPAESQIVLAPKRQRKEVERLHRAFHAELRRMRELAHGDVECIFDRDSAALAEQLGVRLPRRLTLADAAGLRAESGYLIFGRPPAFTGYGFTVWPSLAQVDDALRREAFAGIESLKPKGDPERAAAWVDLKAKSLLMFGLTKDAIETWQEYLEGYPSARDYRRVEEDIQRALGLDPRSRSFRAALSTCDPALVDRLEEEAVRRGWAESTRTLDALVRSVEGACAEARDRDTAVRAAYFAAAKEAVFRGDCALYESLAKRRPDLGTGHPEDAVALEDACR